ncbi:Crp/Fnr family transcriptional regulator [Roseofilum casamattae]|uniref:Crp/Fnr family transcriptional regulator n=1 Tax=Roseofilum casamattae BLCC-M143 TaxID=3022442 RepID=A0ABT7C1G1_9CYAN|nr:Crp/Fnr family transcriptional regulator [Roseofilum casamattae]MDJ1185294.1 Crp/Fnr family transcriptional regulator [Roseofilum casamattae BLCC-M143]
MYATIEQLATIDVFSNLDSTVLTQLADVARIHCYQRGKILIHEGDRLPAQFHAVLEGKLLVQKIAESGKETTLRQLPAGEMFAAPAIFGDGIAPATVKALNDSQIITIDKTILLGLIQASPEISLHILHCFNQRLQEMHQTIHGLISERATVRLARLIEYMAQQYGVKPTEEGVQLNMNLPHQQMARMVGITYEECVRIVRKDLDKIVRYNRGGRIVINDLSTLRSITS